MSNDNASNAVSKKGRRTSIPLLVGVAVLGIGAYYAGPTVMKYVIFYQEQWARNANAVPKDSAVGGATPIQVGAPGSQETEEPGGGRGGSSPEDMFQERDANNDGKLEGEEISEQFSSYMSNLDGDKDGAISKEEFLASMQRSQSPRGGARPPSESEAPKDTPAPPGTAVDDPPPAQSK